VVPRRVWDGRYVTLLRDPVKRVVSEFFWGCGAKVNKRFTGEHAGKVLFDWPRPLWDRMGPGCLKGAPDAELRKWLADESNPAHNRYAKMLANNTLAPPLRRTHNCVIGNEAASMAVWGGRYGMKQGAREAPRSRAELWRAVNNDEGLFRDVLGVLDKRFWFVGILEELDLSMNVFCGLGVCGGKAPPPARGRGRGLLAHGRAHLAAPEAAHEGTFDGVFDSEPGAELEGDAPPVRRRSLLQKHSSKPVGFRLDGATRNVVAGNNALDQRLFTLVRARLHAAAAAHSPADLAKVSRKH